MIVGDSSIFAIESEILRAYKNPNRLGLGSFVIHLRNQSYGVWKADATLLACSFNEVKWRIANRGHHSAPFAREMDAEKIAGAFREAFYSDSPNDNYFGIPHQEFWSLIVSHHVQWAPDGDEAFDDGSYVLQFDVEDRVRLIGFKSWEADQLYDPATVCDVWLPAAEFYAILRKWHDLFNSEWLSRSKTSLA